jgi:hypothetical protein
MIAYKFYAFPYLKKLRYSPTMKIQPKTRFNKYSQRDVPEIKLCGDWLQQLGFESGTRVTVTSMPQLLIIRPTEE